MGSSLSYKLRPIKDMVIPTHEKGHGIIHILSPKPRKNFQEKITA